MPRPCLDDFKIAPIAVPISFLQTHALECDITAAAFEGYFSLLMFYPVLFPVSFCDSYSADSILLICNLSPHVWGTSYSYMHLCNSVHVHVYASIPFWTMCYI